MFTVIADTLIKADNTWALWAILVLITCISIYLEQKYEWAAKITGAIIGLLGAMLLANFNVIPTDARSMMLSGVMSFRSVFLCSYSMPI